MVDPIRSPGRFVSVRTWSAGGSAVPECQVAGIKGGGRSNPRYATIKRRVLSPRMRGWRPPGRRAVRTILWERGI